MFVGSVIFMFLRGALCAIAYVYIMYLLSRVPLLHESISMCRSRFAGVVCRSQLLCLGMSNVSALADT